MENENTKNVRTLKIGYVATSRPRRAAKISPKLLLQGDWLNSFGFAIGDFARIIATDSMIQIIKVQKGGSHGTK